MATICSVTHLRAFFSPFFFTSTPSAAAAICTLSWFDPFTFHLQTSCLDIDFGPCCFNVLSHTSLPELPPVDTLLQHTETNQNKSKITEHFLTGHAS